MYARLAELVSKRTSIPTTDRDVARIIAAVPVAADVWQIVDRADRPFNMVIETVRTLVDEQFATFTESGVALTDSGRDIAESGRAFPLVSHRCGQCQGRGLTSTAFGEARLQFEALASARPAPVEKFDQAYVTTDTVFARLAAFHDRGDLHGRDLLILGDDDLMGLAASLTGLPRKVSVVEIDGRLVEFIQTAADRHGLSLDVQAVDLRQPLPDGLRARFDTFFTDPPDTLAGLELFVARGLESLRGSGCAGYFGATLVESSLRNWRELQARLTGYYRVAISDIVRDFSTYQNWDYLVGSTRDDVPPLRRSPAENWYRSALYRIEAFEDSVMSAGTVDEATLYVGNESLLHTKGLADVASS